MKLHHLGFVAISIAKALNSLRLDEKNIKEIYDDSEQGNLIYILKKPDEEVWIEVIIPNHKMSTVSNSLKEKNFIMHHAGFWVENIEKTTEYYDSLKGSIKLGKYKLFIEQFGGEVQTHFYYLEGTLIELIASG